ESLTNIYRHSGSRTAAVSLVHEDGMLSLYIEDFGKGMGLEESRPFQAQTGVGIRGMRERVRQFGGSLQIESNRTGTRVIARFPAAGDHYMICSPQPDAITCRQLFLSHPLARCVTEYVPCSAL